MKIIIKSSSSELIGWDPFIDKSIIDNLVCPRKKLVSKELIIFEFLSSGPLWERLSRDLSNKDLSILFDTAPKTPHMNVVIILLRFIQKYKLSYQEEKYEREKRNYKARYKK